MTQLPSVSVGELQRLVSSSRLQPFGVVTRDLRWLSYQSSVNTRQQSRLIKIHLRETKSTTKRGGTYVSSRSLSQNGYGRRNVTDFVVSFRDHLFESISLLCHNFTPSIILLCIELLDPLSCCASMLSESAAPRCTGSVACITSLHQVRWVSCLCLFLHQSYSICWLALPPPSTHSFDTSHLATLLLFPRRLLLPRPRHTRTHPRQSVFSGSVPDTRTSPTLSMVTPLACASTSHVSSLVTACLACAYRSAVLPCLCLRFSLFHREFLAK